MSKVDAADTANGYSVRAVERVCRILDLVRDSENGITLAQVAAATQLPKTSAFRYLHTLETSKYVEREDAQGSYRLGRAFLSVHLVQDELLRQRAQPHLERLRDRLEETVNLGLLEGGKIRYLSIVESRRTVRLAARPNDRDSIHSTALGKAVAATLPEDRLLAILNAEGLPASTPETITDEAAFLAELAQVRRQGYAMDNGENEPDGRCVAVALGRYRAPAAISVSSPLNRLPLRAVPDVAHALRETADAIAGSLTGP